MGVSLKIRKGFLFNLIFLFSLNEVYAQDKNPDRDSDETARIEYYKYWNPYRRVLDLRGEPHEFYGQTYYMAIFNKDNRIKTVTKFGKDKNIYNIGKNKEISILNLIKEIENIIKIKIKIKTNQIQKGSVKRRCPDVTKINKFKNKIDTSLKNGLKKTINWYLKDYKNTVTV